MTIQQSKAWETCTCGTTYRKKHGVVVEIVSPGIDGILYFKAPVPDDEFNDMRAWVHEKQLKPVSHRRCTTPCWSASPPSRA
jgi:hypothetical protein